MSRLLLIVLAGFLAGCSGFDDGRVLEISTSGADISIQNISNQTVSYTVIEAETASRVDLAPTEEWPALQPGAGLHYPVRDVVMGYELGDSEAYIYWSVGDGVNRETISL